MAIANPNLPAFFNTDAEFRTWAQAFHDILTNGGWIKTGDTGQIDLTTVVKPAAINTSQGYEIWRMNDAMQSQAPFYMKIEYGSGGAVDRPSVWLTVGSGSNGSGTLSGQVGTRRQIFAGGSKSAGVTLPSYLTAGTNRFAFVSNLDVGNNTFRLISVIERTSDPNGNATADGCLTYNISGGQGFQHQVIPTSGSVPTAGTAATASPFIGPTGAADTTGQVSIYGNNVAMIPAISYIGQPYFWRTALTYRQADVADLVAVTVTEPDATHTFMPFGTAGVSVTDNASSARGFALLWE